MTLAALLVLAVLQPEPVVRDGYSLPATAKPAARAVSEVVLTPPARLYVIPLEWSDLARPAGMDVELIDLMFFSRARYGQQNRLRQQVFGSLSDWLAQNSRDALQLTGRVHPWVTSDRAWTDVKGAPKGIESLLEVVVALSAHTDRLSRLDQPTHVVILFLGSRKDLPAGHPLAPRTTTVKWKDRVLPLMLVDAGMPGGINGVSTLADAYAHASGLEDHAALRERGEGGWCAMGAAGHLPDAEAVPSPANEHRPPHLCAPCKMRMGWLKPATVEAPQRIALRPVERFPDALIVPIDAGEYYLLECRVRGGFDRTMPTAGLLIWHVKGSEQKLVPAHGMTSRDASWKFPACVPFPTPAATSFAPETVPTSRGPSIGAIEMGEGGVAYLEIGGRALMETTFEGDTYRIVPPAPRRGLESLVVRAAFVEFSDIAHVSADAKPIVDLLFEATPRVLVRDAKGDVGRLTTGLVEYVRQGTGGALSVSGGVMDKWIRLPKARADYAKMAGGQREKDFFTPVLAAMDASDADCIVLIVAGAPAAPFLQVHAGRVTVNGRSIPYAMTTEEIAARDIGSAASLVMRAAGIDRAGGVPWCVSGQTVIARDRLIPGPTVPCSWCRSRLGWMQPYEATAAGRFVLSPLAMGNHAVRIPVRDGESYLLENRARWDCDRGLSREGLVIWHVTPPDARCTSCSDAGVLDVWLAHDPPQANSQLAGRYEPFSSLPKKALSLRLAETGIEIAGIKTDARSNVYFEIVR